jgi:hypothetical protein
MSSNVARVAALKRPRYIGPSPQPPVPSQFYSARSAVVGSTRVARHAGT